MSVLGFERLDGGVTAPKGYKAAGVSAGIKQGGYKDIGLLVSEMPCKVAASFTSNKIKAAPVLFDMELLSKKTDISAIIVNSGNANCLTGEQGMSDAARMADLTQKAMELPSDSVLVASTGVIGEMLNMSRIEYGIEKLNRLIQRENNFIDFSNAIMTTDTRRKNFAVEFSLSDGTRASVGISAKGSGMIKPDLKTLHATMLVFISTDLAVSRELMTEALESSVDLSFNRMNVDNDTSTNDSVFLMSNGMAENAEITEKNEDYQIFLEALHHVCVEITKQLAKDGEGANKLVEVVVERAVTPSDAKRIVRAVSESYLVKTAIFGNNPNWGRLLTALGYSGAKFKEEKLRLAINGHVVFENGDINRSSEAAIMSEMANQEITILFDLGIGKHGYNGWTCDLSYDYVKINAHYYT